MKPNAAITLQWLTFAGFVAVVAGTVLTLIAIPRLTHAEFVYHVSLPVAFGFVFYACWQWSAAPLTESAIAIRVRRSLRAASLGALAAAIGFGALTFDWVRIVLQPSTAVYREVFVIGGCGLSTLGYGLAAVGLWIDSSAGVPVTRPTPQDDRSETAPSVG